jgi:alkylation response protein AidB-like acyl-CoA dehydrogenase
LIALDTPGISIRPIDNLAGEDEFCEVFFDEVKVPAENLVGEQHMGWSVAKALLGFERVWIGSPALAAKAFDLAKHVVNVCNLRGDTGVIDRLAVLSADLHDYRLLYTRMCDQIADGGGQPGAEVSMLKVYASELLQRISEFSQDIAAEWGGVIGDVEINGHLMDLHWQLMMARPVTIFAGANEVQRDIIAKTVLGMPA